MNVHTDILQRVGTTRPFFDRIRAHRVLASVLVLLALPWLVPNGSVAVNILIYGLFGVGFNLVFGYMGMLSFGHAALFGIGAYCAGILIAQAALPWWIALPAAVLAAAILALAMGLLAIRTRGIYFAMVTLALSQCVYFLVYQFPRSGGENGLRGVNVAQVRLAGLRIDLLDPTAKYLAFLAVVAAALLALSRVLESPFGGAVEAIRENEARARACGFNVEHTKLLAFVLSGAVCGLAGALDAIHLSSVAIESLHYETSGLVVMICLLGGMGTFFGPFVGAALFLLIQDTFSLWTEHWQLYVGAVFMFFVLFFPKGVWGTILEKTHGR
ncbi:branched-chain amino acid ABC transporter permease [Massilia sp. YIM B02763]|uniref:branched-chain amino acid ABC transporter permease n=1 Tax=Massilia sp. YIM B02763 TaxID=3050130 RepID=UPI0025B716A5|nr:branched-chain amino acid ABC transporter permease [Massilia sp. YIM B02763]MDN4052034.1 branched-chain amino acid ABC transporter permease [Massilia sp. YIM B02763]